MRDSEELLRLIHGAVVAAGIDYDAVCKHMGADEKILTNPPRRSPHELQAYFWAALEAVTGDDEVSLALCPHLPEFNDHLLEYVILGSATIREGIEMVQRFQRMLSDAFVARIIEDSVGSRLSFTATVFAAPQHRHTEICCTYGVLSALRALMSVDGGPVRVDLCVSPRRAPEDYATVFGCPISFGAASNQIWFAAGGLDRPAVLSARGLSQFHRQRVEDGVAHIRRQDYVDAVRSALLAQCQRAPGRIGCTVGDMAQSLGMTERRLREMLNVAGTSFRELLTQSRMQLARHLLAQTDVGLVEIATRTGFADSSAFSRAFHNAVGSSPLRYRKRNQQPVTVAPRRTSQAVIGELCQRAAHRAAVGD